MSGQQWRKALWHLRNGGISGLKEFRQRSRKSSSIPQRTIDGTTAPGSQPGPAPDLSVIIPAFNAAEYIERCLRSVVAQNDVSLEVIVVDDGSRDETAALIDKLAEADPRITLLQSTNSGPAAARNLGIEAASGDFITFVDADDEVLPGAFSSMVDSLRRTGSDIATGSYIRFGATGRSRPKLTARVHARQRLAVRLDDMPELLEEPVLWNKVYGREFWKRHVGTMQTFANYEDQEPVYRAFVAAAAIDVLTKDVYAWRLAEGRRTRSRRKGKAADLRARLKVIEALKAVLVHEPENVRRTAYAIWMGTDLSMHAEYLATATKKFRKTLTEAASEIRQEMPRNAWDLIPAQARLFMWVVASGRLDDIEEVLGTRAEETTAVPMEYMDGHWLVAPTYLTRLRTRVPSRLIRAFDVDFKPAFIVRNVRWVDTRTIELNGCAYVPGIRTDDISFKVRGVMDGATEFDVGVESVDDNRIDLEIGDPWRTYARSGFKVRLDLSHIQDVSPRGIQIIGSFAAHGVEMSTPATSTAVVGMIAPSPVTASGRITVVGDDHGELSIVPVELPVLPVIAEQVSISGERVSIEVRDRDDIAAVELSAGPAIVSVPVDGTTNFRAELPAVPEGYKHGGELIWSVRARLVDGKTENVYFSAVDYLLPATGRLRPEPSIEGKVQLAQRFLRVTVTGAGSDRDRLLLTGRIDPPQKLSLVLKSTDQTITPAEFRLHADGEFTAVYELTTQGPEGGLVAALSGGYHVRFGSTPETAEQWARVAGKLAIRPVDTFTEWNTIRVEGRSSGIVALTASPPWSASERTRFGRFALRHVDWGPLKNGIVFESYNGKSANDNPRAIFDAIREIDPGIPLYWSVRDRRVDVPEGGIPVVEGTAEWHKILATSRVWVNNNNFPYYVRKRTGQFYLQTWHGTPIKKLLWDVPRRKVPLTYRRLMKSEVAQWDLLLAQSEQAANRLQTSLGYRGNVKVIEYPRNLRLLNSMNRTREIRAELEIDEAAFVILYAPTWRASKKRSIKKDQSALLEDLATLQGVTILKTDHHVSSEQINKVANFNGPSTKQVEELMAISDLLITDYSSIAFDYELTGNPLLRYTPDESEYRKERGIYEDFAQMHPKVTRPSQIADQVQVLRSEPRFSLNTDDARSAAEALHGKIKELIILEVLPPYYETPQKDQAKDNTHLDSGK